MQTGSGKTHTMLGEIDDLEVKPSPHRGMTPRIFEFLFARIQAVIFALFASVPFKICLSMYNHSSYFRKRKVEKTKN